MSERRTIKNIVTELFVSNEDAVDAEVIADAVPSVRCCVYRAARDLD